MDRIIEIKVGGNYLTKDSKNAGVRGEGNVTIMRITFNDGWDNYTKKVTFWDARGLNPVEIILTESLLENIKDSTRVYLVPIPSEPMAEAGMFTFVIDGYIDGKRQRTIADKLEVKDSPIAENAGNATAPTPDVYMQLQSNISKLTTDIQNAVIATDNAIEATDAIKNMSVTSEMLESNEDAFVENTGQDGAVNLHFGIPEGKKGETGNSGVYIGDEEPTDENINVWISLNDIEYNEITWDMWHRCLKIKDESGMWIDIPAIKGSSAYDIAVSYGYKGTEEEWNNAVNEARIVAEASAESARQSASTATEKANQASQSQQNASASEAVCKAQVGIATSAANESKASANDASASADDAMGFATDANLSANMAAEKANQAEQSATQAREIKERIDQLINEGKVFSDNNYSDEDKAKLERIAEGWTFIKSDTLTADAGSIRVDFGNNYKELYVRMTVPSMISDAMPTVPAGRVYIYINEYATGNEIFKENSALFTDTNVTEALNLNYCFQLVDKYCRIQRQHSYGNRQANASASANYASTGFVDIGQTYLNTLVFVFSPTTRLFPTGTYFEIWGIKA